MSSQGKNINLLKQLPFYGKTIKPRIKEFPNSKLLSELPFLEKPIKAKIKQPIKSHKLKNRKTMNYYVSYHFMMILIFQENKGHLVGMPKPIKEKL